MNVKKIIAFITAVSAMCCIIASCGDKKKNDKKNTSDTSKTTETTTEAPAVQENSDAVISDNSIDLIAKPKEESENEADEKNSEPAPEFDNAVTANDGDAFLALNTNDFGVQYWGAATDALSYGAGIAAIDGNGSYSVSLTADTDGARYAVNKDVSAPFTPDGVGMAAVIIKNGAEVCPDAVITINSIIADGVEIPLVKKNYTSKETGNIRANIFNEYVTDDILPKDAKSMYGALFDGDSPTEVNDGGYSAQIINKSDLNNWTNITVNFTVSGLDHDHYVEYYDEYNQW